MTKQKNQINAQVAVKLVNLDNYRSALDRLSITSIALNNDQNVEILKKHILSNTKYAVKTLNIPIKMYQ